MAKPKGSPKTGGRAKGTPNRQHRNAWSVAIQAGVDPLEILLKFAAGDYKGLGYESDVYHMETPSGEVKMGFVITPNMRLTAAEKACKFLYPTKMEAEVEHTVDKSAEVNEAAERLEKLLNG